jgi:hypothetical protein
MVVLPWEKVDTGIFCVSSSYPVERSPTISAGVWGDGGERVPTDGWLYVRRA